VDPDNEREQCCVLRSERVGKVLDGSVEWSSDALLVEEPAKQAPDRLVRLVRGELDGLGKGQTRPKGERAGFDNIGELLLEDSFPSSLATTIHEGWRHRAQHAGHYEARRPCEDVPEKRTGHGCADSEQGRPSDPESLGDPGNE